MDLSTIKTKIDDMKYLSIAEFEQDFNLMIANCLAYNSKDTIFYRAGLRMREMGSVVIKSAQQQAREAGIEGTSYPAKPVRELEPEQDTAPDTIDEELANLRETHATTVRLNFV